MIKEIFLPALLVTLTGGAWLLARRDDHIKDIIISIGQKTPAGLRQSYASYSDLLGIELSPDYLAGLKYGLAIGGLILFILFALGQYFTLSGLCLLVAILSWLLPSAWLRQKEAKRQNDIDREFSLMVELLQIFGSASDLLIALRMLPFVLDGELQRQMKLLSVELSTLTLREALDNFAARCHHPQVAIFVSVVRFGIETGADIDDILLTFATRSKNTRFNELKRYIKAQPIVMTIIPALMFFALVMLICIPMVTNIITGLNKIG